MEKQVPWNTGSGNIALTYNGQGNGTIVVGSAETSERGLRQQTITVSNGTINIPVTIRQEGCPLNYKSYDSYYIKTADNKYMCVPPYRELVDANGDNFLTKNNEQFIC